MLKLVIPKGSLEGTTLDDGVLDAGVEHGHRVERLYNRGAVLARQRHVRRELARRQRADGCGGRVVHPHNVDE